MRKIFTILFAALATMFAVSCTSCGNDVKFGVEYDLSVTGKTDAAVAVDFTNGHFSVDGAANLDFGYSNVETPDVLQTGQAVSLSEALASNDARVAKAAADVDEWLTSSVSVTDFVGTYDLYIKGYIKETLTGLKFEVDKRITNIPPNEPVSE